ncbi:MAG: aspartyl protease family protein [Acidobacteria bacterium]|nr:aspartyl protease family protein [Acidobacteriota bacterium]MBV9477442.1 aspartyl protease family protein [Acidobacteriota bacterium]
MRRKSILAPLLLLALAGCSLYNDVTVGPLNLLPSNIERGSDIQSMLRKADYLRAIDLTDTITKREHPNPVDLASLGEAYLAAGRYDDARKILRDALDLKPFRATHAQVAWDLAQLEYLQNNYDASLEWAEIAVDHGVNVRQWHTDFLRAMSNVQAYRFSGAPSDDIPFKFEHPVVPRINVRANGTHQIEAVIDSGAVLSIVSRRVANELGLQAISPSEGTFFGLLGEPIQVQFALLQRLELGAIVIENVPVAIMPDDKMKFLVNKKEGTQLNIDFLLGSNLLKEFRLELRFDRKHARFTRLTAKDHVADRDQNLFIENFRPHVRGAVNRKGWFLFVLDTGSEITFLNQARLATLPIQMFGSGAHSATLQGLGGAMKHGGKVENVEVGIDRWAGTFKTLPMYENDVKEEDVGILGENFLQNFNVVIDFGRMRVDLQRR